MVSVKAMDGREPSVLGLGHAPSASGRRPGGLEASFAHRVMDGDGDLGDGDGVS